VFISMATFIVGGRSRHNMRRVQQQQTCPCPQCPVLRSMLPRTGPPKKAHESKGLAWCSSDHRIMGTLMDA
jgi:hypothetical protein